MPHSPKESTQVYKFSSVDRFAHLAGSNARLPLAALKESTQTTLKDAGFHPVETIGLTTLYASNEHPVFKYAALVEQRGASYLFLMENAKDYILYCREYGVLGALIHTFLPGSSATPVSSSLSTSAGIASPALSIDRTTIPNHEPPAAIPSPMTQFRP